MKKAKNDKPQSDFVGLKEEGDKKLFARQCLGKPQTLGELRSMTLALADALPLAVRNGPLPVLYDLKHKGVSYLEIECPDPRSDKPVTVTDAIAHLLKAMQIIAELKVREMAAEHTMALARVRQALEYESYLEALYRDTGHASRREEELMKMTRAKKDRELRHTVQDLLEEAKSKNLCDVMDSSAMLNMDYHLNLTITVGELRKLALLTGARLPSVQRE